MGSIERELVFRSAFQELLSQDSFLSTLSVGIRAAVAIAPTLVGCYSRYTPGRIILYSGHAHGTVVRVLYTQFCYILVSINRAGAGFKNEVKDKLRLSSYKFVFSL